MATAPNAVVFQKFSAEKKEKDREQHPYNVIEITAPPKNLGIRCFPSCGECVSIEGQAYTVSAVIHQYQLRKGNYEPSEKRLDVESTARYILNLFGESVGKFMSITSLYCTLTVHWLK